MTLERNYRIQEQCQLSERMVERGWSDLRARRGLVAGVRRSTRTKTSLSCCPSMIDISPPAFILFLFSKNLEVSGAHPNQFRCRGLSTNSGYATFFGNGVSMRTKELA